MRLGLRPRRAPPSSPTRRRPEFEAVEPRTAPSIRPIAWQELEQNAEVQVYRTVVESIQVGGVLMSVGIVLWVARAGGLLAAMLTSMPAWKALDPLVLLAPQVERSRLWGEAIADTELHDEEAAVAEVLGDARAY